MLLFSSFFLFPFFCWSWSYLRSVFVCFPERICVLCECPVCWGIWGWRTGREADTSLMRAMKRFPKRQGLCRLHCNELTVICWDCCTATATTCTASYISAASVCKPKYKEKEQSTWSAAHKKSLCTGSIDLFTVK